MISSSFSVSWKQTSSSLESQSSGDWISLRRWLIHWIGSSPLLRHFKDNSASIILQWGSTFWLSFDGGVVRDLFHLEYDFEEILTWIRANSHMNSNTNCSLNSHLKKNSNMNSKKNSNMISNKNSNKNSIMSSNMKSNMKSNVNHVRIHVRIHARNDYRILARTNSSMNSGKFTRFRTIWNMILPSSKFSPNSSEFLRMWPNPSESALQIIQTNLITLIINTIVASIRNLTYRKNLSKPTTAWIFPSKFSQFSHLFFHSVPVIGLDMLFLIIILLLQFNFDFSHGSIAADWVALSTSNLHKIPADKTDIEKTTELKRISMEFLVISCNFLFLIVNLKN